MRKPLMVGFPLHNSSSIVILSNIVFIGFVIYGLPASIKKGQRT